MKKNVGKMDRIVRFSISIVIIILTYARIIPNDFSLGAYAVAVIIGLTGIYRVCPLYKILHKSTLREEPPHFN
ncbi:MAG: hypothetical protein RLZ91_1281 [Bacteroidota bacterium]|jgi:hypothetical protein